MRISLFVYLITLLSLQAIASSAKGQMMNEVFLDIQLQNGNLESVIKRVETATPFRFLYRSSEIQDIDGIYINERSVNVQTLLTDLLDGSGLTFRQADNRILIFKERKIVAGAPEIKAFTNAKADTTVINGIVTDGQTKETIPGATVSVKGSTQKAISDVNGHFSIKAPLGTVILVSYIGYETKEITANKTALPIVLSQTSQSLAGVVVTGIFSQRKSTFTGAERTFTADELSKVSNNNVLQALSSLDPSFQMPDNLLAGSNPNILPDVVLRGGNTLVDIRQDGAGTPFNYQEAPNTPLFILDGFETSLQRINDLDMNRILSVTILKDAGATAIYGSRGANGVIVIERIRPANGKLRFTYNGSTIIEAPDLSGYDLLNAQEKFDLELRNNVYENTFNESQNQLDLYKESRLRAIREGVNTDWLSKPVRNAYGQKHNLYVEGGADAVNYGMSLTYDQRSGVMKGSDRRNTTANSFLSYRLKNFQFRNDLTLTFNKANNSPYGSFTQYAQLNPYWTPYDENGNLKVYLEEVIDPQTGKRIGGFDSYDNLNAYVGRPVNPLYNASLNITDQTSFKGLINNFETRWQAKDWLRLTGRVSYTQQTDESDIFLPAQHSSFADKPTFERGAYTKGLGHLKKIEGFLTGEANKSFGKHFVSASATLNVKEHTFDTQSLRVIGFPNPNLDQLILGNQYPTGERPVGEESIVRSIGSLVRGAYSYDNRYLFDATYRLDGSSQFGFDRRFAPFWSIGAGWNAKNEAFLKDSKALTEMRFRYTVGTTGSENFSSFRGLTASKYYTDREYRGIIASYILAYGNSALAWQKTLKQNFGVDLNFFNRLSITANYFNERTKGSIAFISSPLSTGFDGYWDNMGDVVNKGYEIYTRFNVIKNASNRNNFSVFANLFHVENKIEKISETIRALNERANSTLSSTPLPRYAEGQSVNAIWGVQSLGIDPASGREVFLSRDGSITSEYDPSDQVIVGDKTPTLQGTFGASLEVKNIGFNVFFRFSFGGDSYNQTLVDRVENVDVMRYNVDRRVSEERWQNPGDVAFFRGILDYRYNQTPGITYSTSRFVQKDNFITGKNASVYYRFTDKLNSKLGLQNTKITVFTQDVFRIASIKRERGLDYPFSRSFTLQLQTSF